jgi:hypothetical protein
MVASRTNEMPGYADVCDDGALTCADPGLQLLHG